MPPKTTAPTGMIGVIAQETARYSDFAVSLANLRKPDGWKVTPVYGYDAAYGRHRLAEILVESGLDYMLFLDDDHVFPSNLLERLLSHRKDIVAPLYLKRGNGFVPTAFVGEEPLDLAGCQPGLVQATVTGTSGMLIHRRVFETLGAPYFRAGQIRGREQFIAEDTDFCLRSWEAGFEVWVDTGVPFGHFTPCMVIPAYDDETGTWDVAFNIGGTLLRVPLSQVHEGALT